ncbi:MAG: DUF4020 domain-containing protein [bacterium]|nr:DUF4020 domain-containing protein [bacterium]
MWIADVEIPGELVADHRGGRLVLFVGAGASKASPSNLPLFKELAKEIARHAESEYPDDGSRPDQFLDRLQDEGVDVRRLVKKVIGRPGSEPNPLHRAIVGLAEASGRFRIVTTNYDCHLSTCLPEPVEEYAAPAVPMGRDFGGIVYLHGSLRQEPELLVVTATDFGEAYFNIPWATEFLKVMFRYSTVLFVGYSHSDVLMQYLGHGLPPESKRYAFCKESQVDHWRRLGITPVVYKRHCDLPGVIESWADQARMGMTDHAQRVRDIAGGAPPLSREDESYLEDTVADPVRVRFFTDYARGLPWLRWVVQRPQFQSIFEPLETVGKVGTTLAWWFCRNYVANEELTADALRVVGENGGRLGPALGARVVDALSRGSGDAGLGVFSRWVSLVLAEELPAGGRRRLWWWLRTCDPMRDREMVLLMFDYLSVPVPGLSGSSLVPVVDPWVEPHVNDQYWFTKTWVQVLEPNLENLASDLAPIIDRHLRQAHRIAQVGRDSGSGPDSISLSRPAIEPHEQNPSLGYPKGIHPLVDAARDTLDALLRCSPEEGLHYLRSWSQSEYPLLQRLAIHGWAQRDDASPDNKLRWLMGNVDLFDWRILHEAIQLLAVALPDASEECRNTLVDLVAAHLEAGPRSEERDRETYEYLGWILRCVPELETAQETLSLLQTDHPEWSTPEHPYFPIWTEVGTGQLGPTVPADDLHEQIAASPAEALTHLTEAASVPSGRDWMDTFQRVHETVKEHPADGVALLRELTSGREAEPLADLRLATAVIGALETALSQGTPCEGIAAILPEVWATGTSRWATDADTQTPDNRWLSHSINHWAGQVALIALRLLADSSRSDPNQTQIPDPFRTLFEEMLTGTGRPSKYAQVVLASQLYLLYKTDEPWSLSRVLPLLDPNSDQTQALRCWNGYLTWGRNDQQLLEAGLLNHYLSLIPLLDKTTSEARGAFHHHLADIALFSGINPVENSWLGRFTRTAESQDLVGWIERVAHRLRNMPAEAAEAQWDAWIRTYWQNRLDSRPCMFTIGEASAIPEWAFTLTDSFPEAAELAVQHEAGLDELSSVLMWLDPSPDIEEEHPRPDYATTHPEHVNQLLTHLLSNTETLDSSPFDLAPIIRRLRNQLGQEQTAPLHNQALRLGIEGI